MLLEHDRLDIGQVDYVINDAEFRLGIFRRDFCQRGFPGEANSHDLGEAILGEFAEDLLALRLVLDLKITEIDAGFLLELCRAVEHAFVERFVELAAKIVKNGRLNRVGRIGRDGGEKTSGKSRRRHKRDATEHIQTSVWRERLPSPRSEKLTGWSSRSARNLTVKRGRAVSSGERNRDYAGTLPRASGSQNPRWAARRETPSVSQAATLIEERRDAFLFGDAADRLANQGRDRDHADIAGDPHRLGRLNRIGEHEFAELRRGDAGDRPAR